MPPWNSATPLCYAPAEYLDYHKCRKGSRTAPMESAVTPRVAKKMAVPGVAEMGFDALRDDEQYKLVISEARTAGEQIFKAARGIGQVIAGQGGILTALLYLTVAEFMSSNQPGVEVDLKPYFDRFERRVNNQAFKLVLDEIESKYVVFIEWFRDLQQLENSTLSEKVLERFAMRTSNIDMQLDLAGTLFTRRLPVDQGMSAFYLFRPLFNHAFLHVQVILKHAAFHGSLQEDVTVQNKLARARSKYDLQAAVGHDARSRIALAHLIGEVFLQHNSSKRGCVL